MFFFKCRIIARLASYFFGCDSSASFVDRNSKNEFHEIVYYKVCKFHRQIAPLILISTGILRIILFFYINFCAFLQRLLKTFRQ